MKKQLTILLVAGISLVACGQPTPDTHAINTAIAQTSTAEASKFTPTFTSTEPPPTTTFTPTSTHAPTQTHTPTVPPRPIHFQDDFSHDTGSWIACGKCEWENGALYMGPYPASEAYVQQITYCLDCGLVTNYKISVDATYEEGPSERGYGLILRETDEYLMTCEITPWQTVDVWKYEFLKNEWTWVNGKWTGAVNTGRMSNHIEVEVTSSGTGKSQISVTVNGRTVLVLWNQPADQSPVGLTLYGHALQVYFDNFEFEEYEPYGTPLDLEKIGGEIGYLNFNYLQ